MYGTRSKVNSPRIMNVYVNVIDLCVCVYQNTRTQIKINTNNILGVSTIYLGIQFRQFNSHVVIVVYVCERVGHH